MTGYRADHGGVRGSSRRASGGTEQGVPVMRAYELDIAAMIGRRAIPWGRAALGGSNGTLATADCD
jgi:hypothetical protein